jgi:hypothetical protein
MRRGVGSECWFHGLLLAPLLVFAPEAPPASSANAKTVAATAMNLAAADSTKASDLDVGHWVAEGIQNAKDSVYTDPVGAGAGPFTLTDDYKNAAKALAKSRSHWRVRGSQIC